MVERVALRSHVFSPKIYSSEEREIDILYIGPDPISHVLRSEVSVDFILNSLVKHFDRCWF